MAENGVMNRYADGFTRKLTIVGERYSNESQITMFFVRLINRAFVLPRLLSRLGTTDASPGPKGYLAFGIFFCALSAIRPACAVEPEKARPNVLLITIDDLRTELGCYGVPYAVSPNLDRFATEGVRFNNHFVQVPTCGASRYALLTGRSPAASGALGNNAFFSGASRLSSDELEGAQTLPELFRRSGYHTVALGKVSHTPDGRVFAYDGSGDGRPEMPHAWNSLPTPFGDWGRGWGIMFAYAGGRHREDGGGHRDVMEFLAENDNDLPDGMIADAAIEQLQALDQRHKSGQPFFLALGFFKPHLPFVAPRQDWEAMERIDVPAPVHPDKPDSRYWHKSGEFYKYKMTFEKSNPLAKSDAIRARRAYLACVRYVDRQVGRVLEELDRLGLRDTTHVIVWGDHGWHLGESAIWGKHAPYDRTLRSTLIMRMPGVSRAGTAYDGVVETLDIYPTLLDLCDPAFQQTSHPLDGVSLRSALQGDDKPVRDAALSYWRNAVSVRTDDYRMIVTKGDGGLEDIELYDVSEGPDPVHNVAADKPAAVEQLKRLLPSGS